jgi:hypothetical protein
MEFTTEESPQTVLEAIEEFKADCNAELEIESDLENKCIILQDKSRGNLKLKLKMFKAKTIQEEDPKLKLKFVRKAGTLQDQYELMEALSPFIWGICVEDEDEEVEEG